nr:hypothetical protein [Nocardia tengchongensis]
MTDPAPAATIPQVDPATPFDRITERIDDLARVIARQAATIERLADAAKLKDREERAEADAPLLRDLFALHGLAQTFVSTSNSEPDRQGFEAINRRVERMLAERGGELVTPFRARRSIRRPWRPPKSPGPTTRRPTRPWSRSSSRA